MDKQTIREFRDDFDEVIAKLEKAYNMSIDLGNIRFNSEGLRAKLTGTIESPRTKHSINEFSVGDYVGIHHPKFVERNASFKVIKVNRVKVIVEGRNGEKYTISPSILIKKSIVGIEL